MCFPCFIAKDFTVCYTCHGELMSKSTVKKANINKLPIGISDFKEIINGDYYYVDKSLFVKDIIDRGDKIILLPRPRRFGKTLNLSMLRYFFDCCPDIEIINDTSTRDISSTENTYKKIFDNLAITQAGQKYLDKMGEHPVIYLTFKNIKEQDWETAYRKIKKLIQDEYLRHDYLLNSLKLKPQEKDFFKSIINLKGEREDYGNSLGKLLIFLYHYYGKRPVILIDEYDAPVHMGYNRGYYDDIINFMRNFLSGGL